MPTPTPYLLTLPGNPDPQDRLQLFREGNRLIIALADGAGGLSGGAQAADTIIRVTSERAASLTTPDDCRLLLEHADQLLAHDPIAGETTAIVLNIEPGRLFGASVGDSEAWLYTPTAQTHLTRSQQRKPLLGSGVAAPAPFTQSSPEGILIVASDGLWKYTSHEKIAAQLSVPEISTLPHRLADLVRLRSGALQDDLAIAIIPFQ
jgi:serine/threonine protein phosphatase PrpC